MIDLNILSIFPSKTLITAFLFLSYFEMFQFIKIRFFILYDIFKLLTISLINFIEISLKKQKLVVTYTQTPLYVISFTQFDCVLFLSCVSTQLVLLLLCVLKFLKLSCFSKNHNESYIEKINPQTNFENNMPFQPSYEDLS